MTRARAADDFATIHRRMKELRRETAPPPQSEAAEPNHGDAQLSDRRMKERREGLPPPWVPTIFMQKPTRLEIACRFWHMRADFEK